MSLDRASQKLEEGNNSTTNLKEIFNEFENEIKICMKKFQDAYTQSDSSETKGIEELVSFQTHIRQYEINLNQKLKYYKDTIAKFSKILNIQIQQ